MAALVTIECPSCGNVHKLCSSHVDLVDGRTMYLYVCPNNGHPVQMTNRDWAKTVSVCPTDAVTFREV